jgi:hypothetical protein
MLGGQIRWQGREQAAAAHHPLKGQERVFLMQFQAQVGRQNEPAGDLFLFANGGHGLGQAAEEALLETAVKEVTFVGLADDLQAVELTAAKGGEHGLGMVFDQGQVHGGGQSIRWLWAI